MSVKNLSMIFGPTLMTSDGHEVRSRDRMEYACYHCSGLWWFCMVARGLYN